jgi:hypothetical protein
MKIKLFIMLIFAVSLFSLSIDMKTGTPVTVDEGLTAANTFDFDAMLDSLKAFQAFHIDDEAVHEVEDSTTVAPTGSGVSLPDAIRYANSIRASMVIHFAIDSVHVNGKDATTTIPGALNATGSLEAFKTYSANLRTAWNTHKARAHSTRYKFLLKELIADFIAHCANDTIDGGTVHYKPDTTFNTVAMDSTGAAVDAAIPDSLYSAANVLKRHYNGHVGLFAANGSNVHQGHVAADSVTVANATNYTTLVALVNSIKAKYNAHCARTSSTWVTSIHKAADATNTSTVAAVSTASGHIVADSRAVNEYGHYAFKVPDNTQRITLQYSGSSITTGASFRIYGSLDGVNWAYIDSTATITTPTLKHLNTNYYPYIKTYMSKRTDGTWTVKLQAEKEK